MAWQPNKPAATDRISSSQADIQGNFQALDNIFNGINNFIKLPVQGSAPTTTSSQMALYSRTSSASGSSRPEMVVERQSSSPSSAPEFLIEFTALQTISSPPNTSGWTRLPSGLVIKWGKQQFAGNPEVINLNSTGPVLTNAFMAQTTGIGTSSGVICGTLTATTLSVSFASPGGVGTQFYWLVFGTEF